MTRPALVSFTLSAFGVAALAAQSREAPRTVAPPASYVVLDLGVPGPSTPMGTSGAGHVTGNYFAAGGERRAFVWNRGTLADAGTLGGTTQMFAVNGSGVAVGYSVDARGSQRAVAHHGGALVDLGVLRGGTFAAAHDISDAGWVVGVSQVRIGNEQWQRAALWREGHILDLGTFGGEYSEAFAVNEAGQVVGWAWHPLPRRDMHAFLWSERTGMLDLGTLGGVTSVARDINDHGTVVGSARTSSGETHAFRWTEGGGMSDLGVPAGAHESYATAIDDEGRVVGFALLSGELRVEPLLWRDGVAHRLNDMIDARSGWTVIQPFDIDDAGRITASARLGTDSYRAVLLIPR